jgi:predicted nuclease of predicted toxin-antitoxin system
VTFIVDENISLAVVNFLKSINVKVIYIADKDYAGISDTDVFKLAVKENAWLITRDYHFTHSIRFPSDKPQGIIYVRQGNLSAEQEVNLVKNFLKNFDLKTVQGHLVTLHIKHTKTRPPYKNK